MKEQTIYELIHSLGGVKGGVDLSSLMGSVDLERSSRQEAPHSNKILNSLKDWSMKITFKTDT